MDESPPCPPPYGREGEHWLLLIEEGSKEAEHQHFTVGLEADSCELVIMDAAVGAVDQKEIVSYFPQEKKINSRVSKKRRAALGDISNARDEEDATTVSARSHAECFFIFPTE